MGDPLQVDARATVAAILHHAHVARLELEDEAEGPFTAAVLELERLSHELAELVRAW